MHDRPTAGELIAAVREHLESQVVPALEDAVLRFRTRVAAHALAIVERELSRGEAPLREEWRRLQELLARSEEGPATAVEVGSALRGLEEELCRRIRSGAADAGPFRDAVLRHVRETLAEKLRVANPSLLSGR
jgi:hypothetical protein